LTEDLCGLADQRSR